MAKTNISTAQRRAFVLEKRRAGHTFRQIARAAIEHFGEEHLPKGWDERYANKDCKRALAKLEKLGRKHAREVLELELIRLDALQASLWEKASTGNVEAVHACLRVMRHRQRLLPLKGVAEESITAPQETSAVEKIANAIDAVAEKYDLSKYDEELEDQ